jgi:hypothetical protein
LSIALRPSLEALETGLTPGLSTLASFNITGSSNPRAALIEDSYSGE